MSIKVKVSATATYRSKPVVNMTDDMIRVVLDMTRHDWHRLKKMIQVDGQLKGKVDHCGYGALADNRGGS